MISTTLREKLRRSTRARKKPKKSNKNPNYVEIDSDSGEETKEDVEEPMEVEEQYKISREVDEFMKNYDKFLKELIVNY